MEKPVLSICIPTNGIVEWVIPVLDSIYKNEPDKTQFEVVIEDNGGNEAFEKIVKEYQEKYKNIAYYKSSAQGFLCQIDCFIHAQGEFVKFVNHRARLVDNSLEYLIEFANKHKTNRPVVFFSNGQIENASCNSFDSFVSNLKYWSSWSGGLAFWKEDIEKIADKKVYNALFPHTDLLFAKRDCVEYIIDDKIIFSEIEVGHSSKGRYNLFKAFAVEYPSILCDMLRDGSITVNTFIDVKDSLLDFLADCYIDFIIRKKPASYNFDNYKEYLRVYFSRAQVQSRIMSRLFSRIINKVLRLT